MKVLAYGVLMTHLLVALLQNNVPSTDMAVCAICLAAILQPKDDE